MLAIVTSVCAARTARAEDDFWGPDKALHFGVSAGLAAGGYAASSLVWDEPWQRALAGASLSLSAGIAKELWDAAGHGDPSFKDLAWDGIGTGVGVGLALAADLLLFRQRHDATPSRSALVIRF
ncbi:MAG: hypothetical protein ACOY0T_08770 [Myxococcota bacterium]